MFVTRHYPWLPALVLMPLFLASSSPPGDLKLEVQLIWGTNDQKSPDAKHKPVDQELKKRLQSLPLKWTNYFEVNRLSMVVPQAGTQKAPLSDRCQLEVKNLGHSKVEITVFGKGKNVATRTQALPKGETLILGGDSPGATSWLAVVRRVE